jgi:leucyl aminopeptidase (aminopeptidase T)
MHPFNTQAHREASRMGIALLGDPSVMSPSNESVAGYAFERWIPLARMVVRQSLGLRWNDVLEIYSYVSTIPLAEALAIEARRVGSDTHITLMTDDLWFTSMKELPTKWLKAASEVEVAINKAITAYVYLGGPQDARRMQEIPAEKFNANAIGNQRQDEPRTKRRVRHIDLPIGRVCRERAEAYGLDFELWQKSYNASLSVDLKDIQRAGREWFSKLKVRTKVRITSDAGTDLSFRTGVREPMIEDGIVSASDVRHGFVSTSLPAGKVICSVQPRSVEGEARFADPVFLMGRSVKGLRVRFEHGKLVEWGAEENAELMNSVFEPENKLEGRMNWFSVGLNAAAEPCMLDNSVVKDDVAIGLGHHPALERSTIRDKVNFDSTIGLADVEIRD